MKSSQWRLLLTSGILKYCLRGLFRDLQRKTLFELCDVVAVLTNDSINIQDLDSIEYRAHRVLSLIERDFYECYCFSPPSSLNYVHSSFWSCKKLLDVSNGKV